MADRIIAKVFTPRNIQARSVAPSPGVQASSVWLGSGLNLADLSDVVIPPANAVTGALMTYDAQTGGFIVLKDIDSPNLKLIGGAF
jgi:hypothetical protein